MARGIILVLDSCGIGAAPDAEKFGDTGADTFGHIVEACARGEGDQEGLRSGPLQIPNLIDLGFAHAAKLATGKDLPGIELNGSQGLYAACAEQSFGKDTPSGHWEIAGVPCRFDWGYFSNKENSFPPELLEAFIAETGVPGILGNCAASGTEIIARLGAEHMSSGKPILYTSADSVLQIAAHEETYGLDRLYAHCDIARKLVDKYEIGRVIARPFIGDSPENFKRTGNRRDLATPPPAETLLDLLKDDGREVMSIGKIADIFAHRGLTQKIKATGNAALFDATHKAVAEAPDGSLIFTNFVDFDQEYGHRRNVPGYAAALEA
ncbi:MAG: phosphopentomutase, partial [Alphaproteobacteria bacterium]